MTTPQPPFQLNGVGIWTFALDTVPASRAREHAAEIESLGYSALWIPEVSGRDPFVHLAMLLGATQKIVGATGIANIWARDAVAMVEATSALTEAFPERLLVGLGVSHQHLVEKLRGHEYGKPVPSMRAYLERMAAAPYTAFKPATPVRIVLAALGPLMTKLSGERALGAHPYFVPPEHTVGARAILGKGPLLCVEQAVLLETDPVKARAIARVHTDRYLKAPNYVNNLRRLGYKDEDFLNNGSDRLVDALVGWGDEKAVVKRVQEQFAAGASHVCIQPLPHVAGAVPDNQWRALAPAMRTLRAGAPG